MKNQSYRLEDVHLGKQGVQTGFIHFFLLLLFGGGEAVKVGAEKVALEAEPD
jgi:hypothetical protein